VGGEPGQGPERGSFERVLDLRIGASREEEPQRLDVARGGGVVAPTSVNAVTASPSWSYNPANRRIRAVEPNQDNSDDDGTAIVSFMDAIEGFQLSYRNPVTSHGNQWIALSDIAFLIIPEPDPAPLLAAGALALWLARRRRA
jgi:hypothetical protein